MTAPAQDAAPFIQALSFAFYALHARLVENGALKQGEVSEALRAFDPGPDLDGRLTGAVLAVLAANLDAHAFGPAGMSRRFDVIDGGKEI